jgi:hypothetical protein
VSQGSYFLFHTLVYMPPKTTTNMKYSPFAVDAVKNGASSEIICKAYRDALYNKTKLGSKMKTIEGIEELRKYVIKRFYKKFPKKENMILPSRSALNISTVDLLQHPRSKAESRMGTSTIGQCNNSIGKKQPTFEPRIDDRRSGNNKTWHGSLINNDNGNWEKRTCWLCGFPLQTFSKKISIGVDCEHKLAMLIMMLIGAGLKKTKPRAGIKEGDTRGEKIKKMIIESAEKKKVAFPGRTKYLHPDWKILVRAEGYAWSHSYCNQYKSQIPFISLKYNENAVNGYEYVIEINNILQYIGGLFDATDKELKSIFTWYEYGPTAEENNEKWKEYGKAKMKLEWQKHINLDGFTVTNNDKAKTIKNAFNNIIDMLIPTYFLLNIGGGIDLDLQQQAREYFQNNKDQEEQNKDRSFVGHMNDIPIKGRLQDNIGRILGWLSKGKKTEMDKIIDKINSSGVDNPIKTYLNKKGSQDIEAPVLELFNKGAWPLQTVKEEEDKGDDIADLVKERDSESNTSFFSLEVPNKRKHPPRALPLESAFEDNNILGRRLANNISPTPEKMGPSSTEREGLKRGDKKKKGDKGRDLWKQGIRGGKKRSRRRKRKRKRTRRKKRKKKRSKKKRRRKKRTRRR